MILGFLKKEFWLLALLKFILPTKKNTVRAFFIGFGFIFHLCIGK